MDLLLRVFKRLGYLLLHFNHGNSTHGAMEGKKFPLPIAKIYFVLNRLRQVITSNEPEIRVDTSQKKKSYKVNTNISSTMFIT